MSNRRRLAYGRRLPCWRRTLASLSLSRSFKTAVVIIALVLCGVGIHRSSQSLNNWTRDSEKWVKYHFNPKHGKKILYVVRSYSESNEWLDLQAKTWMNHLDAANEAVFVASQSSPNAHLPDGMDFTFVTSNCTQNNHGIGLCCREAHAVFEAATKDKFQAFDWIFFVEDDVFVSPSILRQIAQEYDETSLVSIGSTGCISQSYSGFCRGGYLVSHTALKKIAAIPNFASEYMNVCNKTNKCDITTAWMLENEADVTLVNERRLGAEVDKVLNKNYENEAWQLTHRLIHKRQNHLSHLQRHVHNITSSSATLPTMDMFEHLLKTPKVLQAIASRQYATLHNFGGDLTEAYSTKSQKFIFLNLLFDVALEENEEQIEHGESPTNMKDKYIPNADDSKGRCLRDTKPHPVSHRESPIHVFGPDRESPISVNPKPGIGSIRTVGDHLELTLQHLDESSTLEKMRLLTFEEKCVRNFIPRKFHWIWFGSEIPEKYISNIEQMAVMNTGWEVFLWSDFESKVLVDRLEKLSVQYNFKNVTKYFEEGMFTNGDLITSDTNMAGKSDYLRLEVVYLEGGIYQDTDAHPLRPFDNFGDLYRWPFVTYDTSDTGYGNLCNCVFGFEKGSKLLEFAIELTRENCLKYNTCGVMSGAGPGFLTSAVNYFDDPDIVFVHKQHLIQGPITNQSVTQHDFDATWLCDGELCEGVKEDVKDLGNHNDENETMSATIASAEPLDERSVDENKTISATTQRSQPRLFSVFSTECSPYQDWQAQTLIHNHKKQGIQGFLVRLLACDDPNYVLPKHSYEKYRVVRMPDFGLRGDDNWSVRNKPFSIEYWLDGSSDDNNDLPEDDDIVMSIDPDMIFLSSDINLGSIKDNHGVASRYSLGSNWVKDWALPFCDGKCDDIADPSDVSFGAPYMLKAKDMLRLARLWKNLVDEMRSADKSWHLDMLAVIIAARRLGIAFTVERNMIGNTEDGLEPWDLAVWGKSSSNAGKLQSQNDPLTVQVAHYCQSYSISSYHWGKHDYHNLDIRKCDRVNNAFNMPSADDAALMTETRGGELTPVTDATKAARNVWLLDVTMSVAHEAIESYNAEFCVPSPEHTNTS